MGKGGGLCRNPRATREDVQRHALTEENLAHRATNGRAVLDRRDGLSFSDMPFDPETC